jgi:tRNA(Arg) A34 adenosine deaminase TadA
MNYLRQAVDLARKSLEAGAFPAGAVLVTISGNVYESAPSVAWNHGECMAIDKAIKAEGGPLTGAVMCASMESCLMCSSKMYWAGITKVYFVMPKSRTNTLYAYEDNVSMHEHLKNFNTPIEVVQDDELLDEAVELYETWTKKIESTV